MIGTLIVPYTYACSEIERIDVFLSEKNLDLSVRSMNNVSYSVVVEILISKDRATIPTV